MRSSPQAQGQISPDALALGAEGADAIVPSIDDRLDAALIVRGCPGACGSSAQFGNGVEQYRYRGGPGAAGLTR